MTYSFTLKLFTRFTPVVLLVSLIAGAVQVRPVYAAGIVVNSPADTVANDGVCTLREALVAAQQNAAFFGCAAGAGADVITFNGNYTIPLSSQFAVASEITIQGNGVTNTIIQANAAEKTATHRVFEVGGQGNLTLENLTVRHGSCNGNCASPSGISPNGGAGIWNAGALTVRRSAITNNFAVEGAGIWNGGSLTVENSVFSSNATTLDGAGILNAGTLTITGSTFSNNSARNGGGMVTRGGIAMIVNSTFSANSAASMGGGIWAESPSVFVTNSTFSGNSAPAGGGGIFNSGKVSLRNTIVADSPIGDSCMGTIINDGGNLDDGTTCGWGSVGGSLSKTDPNLAPLADNAGPTKTHALPLDSPAVGKGLSVSCPTTDQRGVARHLGTFCDIGAYETYSIVVDGSIDTIADDGLCSLREAIRAANENIAVGGCLPGSEVGIDSIRISVRASITIGSQLPAVTSLIIIAGAGPNQAIIQANANPNMATYRVFEVGSSGDLTLNHLTVRHGHCSGSCDTVIDGGGGILNQGTLTVLNSTISANSATKGGGVWSNGSLTVTNSTFAGNSATDNGGGILSSGTLTVTNSTFAGNSATNNGGGAYNDGTATATNSTFSDNSAGSSGGGGGVSNAASITLKNTIVANNPSGQNCAGTITDGSGNLSWPDTTCPGLNADPRLGSLADHGGPTPTAELLSGSPAIDAGFAANCQDTDQRGGTRPLGDPCDIGAYEFGATIIVITPPPTATFSDVPISYWAWDFIERLYNAGITGGCNTSPLQYCPEGVITRAQLAVFLERGIHGSSYTPPAVGSSTGFSDVSTGYWAAAWIKQLAAEGITGGCGGGNYCPEASVTRAQMAVFLLRAEHGSGYAPPAVGAITGFGDVPLTYWAAAWIKQLVAEGITSGCGSGTYCPESPVTRAQMAVFLVRIFNLP